MLSKKALMQLDAELKEMERTDPELRKIVEDWDQEVFRMNLRRRIQARLARRAERP